MPKSLLLMGWTLVVAAVAFTAGCLMQESTPLPVDNPSLETHLPAAQMPLARASVGVANPQLSRVVQAKSSYATDYQQLQLLLALAATNPALAMEKAGQFKGAIKAKAQAEVLDIWGGLDPNAAWSWVQLNQPENNSRFISLLETIGRKDPRMAVAFAEKFAETHREYRKDIYSSLITGLTQNGAYRMSTDLVGRLEIEPDTKAELINSIVGIWASYEPHSALQWLMTQPEDFKVSHLERLVESWSDADPQGAVDFAAAQSGAMRESLLFPAFKKWLAQDASSATAWLSAAQSHKDFDPVIAELATQPIVTNGDVKNALIWAGRVHDPELRINTVTSILSAFKQKDPKMAAVYLQEATFLSDTERARLIEDLVF